MFIVVKNSKINEHIKYSTTEILPSFSIILNQHNTGCIQIYTYNKYDQSLLWHDMARSH